MKKIILSLGLLLALALGANAQVKIKDGSVSGTSTVPNTTAILDLESSNKGLHLPRVSLLATNNPRPLLNETSFSTMDSGLVVYNLATAGAAPYNVTPGLYYCDGTQWVRAANKPDWLIFGNATAAVNGTPAGSTDSQYVMGRVAIGRNTAPRLYSTAAGGDSAHKFAYLTVNGDASINGIAVGMGGGQVGTNTAVGVNALNANTTGGDNTAVGNYALFSNAGYQNTAVGYQNTAVGSTALYTNTTGNQNTAVGFQALTSNTTGNQNTAVGSPALLFNTTGYNNTAVGYQTLYYNTSGRDNTAQGYDALYYNTSGSYNTAQGYYALLNTTGSYNTAMGVWALLDDTSGNYNVGLGYQAGGNLYSGSTNIAIGYNTGFLNTAGNYQLNIGNAIYGTGVDSTVTGAANIGINTFAPPTSSFQVNGSVSTNISVQSGSYTLKATDYTVVFTGGAAVTATLPPAANISGRMYRIVASGTGTTVTVFSSSGTVMLLPTITTLTGQSAIFQSNGSTWYQVQ